MATKSSSTPSNVNLAVLNVDTLQIEEIAFDDAFLALSYVLGRKGDAESWKFTDDNGTVWIRSDQLPPTISDAIALCRHLGERYIWIDQLSIDQKNPAKLSYLINEMDRVYASALATIIVACNDCADERIACRMELSSGLDSGIWREELQRSCWSERGWTYQEMQLSRRLLVITASGIFYHCAKEDERFTKLPIWSLPSIQDVSCWSAYSTIVAEYTSRRLSHKIDTLNAIAGMIRSLARFTDDSFLAGIPSKFIHCGLLWQPTAPCIRQPQWPSWSWAGWTGHAQSMCPIVHPSDGHFESYDADPHKKPWTHGGSKFSRSIWRVKFHVPNSDVQLELNEENLESGARSRYRQTCTGQCAFPCTKLSQLAADKPFYENGILTFTAQVMTIRIEPTRQQSPKFPKLYQCRLLIGETLVGAMFLSKDHLPHQTIADAEFVVLTHLRSYTDKYREEVFGGMLGADPNTAPFEETVLERAEKETEVQGRAWMAGKFHARRGWNPRGQKWVGRMHRDDEFDDPHRGMPYPPTIALSHVLWIVRDEEHDFAFRKGLGVITSIQRGHKELVRLA